jgi:hypothetical protein
MEAEHEDARQATDDLIWRWHDNVVYGLRLYRQHGEAGMAQRSPFDIDYTAE